jgi:cyclic beta-1,2-glucan synthetase
MYRILIESVLGITVRDKTLSFSPCIPKTWRSFEVTVNHRGSRLHVLVENPHGLCRGRCTVAVDGIVTGDGRVPFDGKNHEVHVLLGAEDPSPVPFLQAPEPPESKRRGTHAEDHRE